MRKIRAVSIILILTIIMGLLPAEQVFAAESIWLHDPAVDELGMADASWCLWMMVADESEADTKTKTWVKSSPGTGEDRWEDNGNIGLVVDGGHDSISEVISNPSAHRGVQIRDNNGDNTLVAYNFTSQGSPHRFDETNLSSTFVINTGRSFLKGNWFTGYKGWTTTGGSNGFCEGVITVLGAMQIVDADRNETYTPLSYVGTENIYRYDFAWQSNSVSDTIDLDSTSKDWLYQRVWCDYNEEKDVFVYFSVLYAQNQGGADHLIISGKISDSLEIVGIKPSPSSNVKYISGSANDYDSKVEDIIAGWAKKTDTFTKLCNVLNNCLGSKVSFRESDICANTYINIKTEFDEKSGSGLPWVTSSNGSAMSIAIYSMMGNEPPISKGIGSIFDITSAYYDDRVYVTVGVKFVKNYCILDTDPSDIVDNTTGRLQMCKSHGCMTSPAGRQVTIAGCVSSFDIEIIDIAWGDIVSGSADEGNDNWKDLILKAYSYSNVLKQEFNSGRNNIVFLPGNNRNESHTNSLIKGIGDVFKILNDNGVDVTNYRSDTGVNVLEVLDKFLVEGNMTINYNPVYTSSDYNLYYDSRFDWRKLSVGMDSEIEVNTIYDLLYVVSYIKYINGLEGHEPKIKSVLVSHKDTEIVLVMDTSISSGYSQSYLFGKLIDEDGNIISSPPTDYSIVHSYSLGVNDLFSWNNYIPNILGIDSYYKYWNKAVYYVSSAYCMLTGDKPLSNRVFTNKDDRAYEVLGINEDKILELNTSIKEITLMNTNTVLNNLVDTYNMYLYALIKFSYGVGEDSISGVPYVPEYESLLANNFSRKESLTNTTYSDKEDSDVDYLPRLPRISLPLNNEIRTLFYNVDYGLSVLDWSTFSDINGYSEATVKEWLSDNNDVEQGVINKIKLLVANESGYATAIEWAKSGVYDNISIEYLHLFKCIVNTHRLCDELAELESIHTEYSDKSDITGERIAKQWSPAVLKYYTLYKDNPDFFEAIEKNLFKLTIAEFSYSNAVEPLGFVIKFEDSQMSAQWKYGYALSSMYIPFRTNVYEVSSIEHLINDTEWVTEFYYKYGFYRKALFVTTDPEATVNRYLTGSHSGTKVATLRDLLNYDRDVELYIDQGFYNSSQLELQLDRFIQNNGEDSIFDSIFDACALTPGTILKESGYSTYSSDIFSKVKPIGYELSDKEKTDGTADKFKYDNFLLSEDEILGNDGMLSAYEYSIQQPYGVVSAIYRSQNIFNTVNKACNSNLPVFVSSKNLAGLSGTDTECYRSFYNYVALASLQEVLERETTLLVDLDAPIFMDIFGNIVTGDGYVIIPAAANATLSGEKFNPYSLGFATFMNVVDKSVFSNLSDKCNDFLYGLDYAYAAGKKSASSYSSSFREQQQKVGGGYLYLRQDGTPTLGTTALSDGVATVTVTWDNPNTQVAALKDLLFSVHYINSADTFDDRHISMVVEVLRGAPVEFIDYAEENLNTSYALTKAGAYVSYKLEQLMNAIQTDSNGTERNAKFSATLNVLDIFHIESAEKVALIAVKCLLVGFLLLLAIQIVADATIGKMPLNTMGRVIMTCVLTGTCITLLPVLTEFSLSVLTKNMMQAEASELLAMQAQRDAYGVEIGTTQSYNTESSTDIIVHVGQLDVSWYDKLLYSAYSSVNNSFMDLYNEAAENLPLAKASYTFTSGREIYMDLSKVMDTTVLQYNAELGILTNQLSAGMIESDYSSSYLSPYYVFLDQLVANVNLYNKRNGVQPLVYSVNSDGSIRTQDMTYAYFHSNEFMSDDYDILDLYRILGIQTPKLTYCNYFSDEDIVKMSLSLWYPTDVEERLVENSIKLLYSKAREYVNNNSYMLSFVSDAAYLKSLAMYLAIEYNSIFDVGTANSFELKCVDTKDLLRYVVSTPTNVYKFANRSFARYAYETGGTASVLLAGLLYLSFCLSNAVKVIAYVLTYITSIGSIAYHRLFKREDDYTIYGFFMLIGEITILNLIYAVTFKLLMNLTRWGVPPVFAMLIGIILQFAIVGGFVFVCFNGVKNIKNLGRREVEFVHHMGERFSRDRVRPTSAPAASAEVEEQTVAVLQAHDFSRRSNDNYNGDRATLDDLLEHDRRREAGNTEES